MTLASSITSDATTVFLDTDEFGETVTYVPYQGAERSITAVVEREQVAVVVGDSEAIAPRFVVHVHNDSTTGIAGDELDVGRDSIRLPSRDGESAVLKTITLLETQDPGMLVITC